MSPAGLSLLRSRLPWQTLCAMKQRAVLCAAMALLCPVVAHAWSQSVMVSPVVHGHQFQRVSVESSDCSLKVRLSFDAPADGYKNRGSALNYYKFKGRLKFDSGHVAYTPVFGNSGSGARVYDVSIDTSREECWAKAERKLQGVDIEGCRGRGCTPEPFK